MGESIRFVEVWEQNIVYKVIIVLFWYEFSTKSRYSQPAFTVFTWSEWSCCQIILFCFALLAQPIANTTETIHHGYNRPKEFYSHYLKHSN